MLSDMEVSELVCTRIAHDLIGNIGAVANANELLAENDLDFLPEIRKILQVSSGVLASRLKFFRMAFGVDNNPNLSDMPILSKTIADYLLTLGNPNLPVVLSFVPVAPEFSRSVMLMVVVLADLLYKGGKIWLKQEQNAVVLTAEAQVFSKDKADKIAKILSGADWEKDAQMAPLFYLLKTVQKIKAKICFCADDNLTLSLCEA